MVKVNKNDPQLNEEIVLVKDEKCTPEAVVHRDSRSVFVKIQGLLKRFFIKEKTLEVDSVNLHTFPSDKFAKFYINPAGDRLASLDVNGAVRMFDIEKTRLKALAGFGMNESLSKTRKSSLGREKGAQGDTRNPFNNHAPHHD